MSYDDRPWLKFYDEGVEADMTIPDITVAGMLENSFSDFADKPAMYFMGTTLSFKQLDEYSCRFATFLKEIGCGAGDVVGLNMPNLPQYLIALAGTHRAGCAASGVSPLLSGKEMAHQINDCGARVLVTLDAIFEGRFLPIKDKLPNLTHVVATSIGDYMPALKRTLGKLLKKIPSGKVVPVPDKTVLTFKELLGKYPANAPDADIKPEDICMIQYTGGTTGLPKGAELTHRNIVTNLLQIQQWFDTRPGKEVLLSGFPFFHIAGFVLGMCGMTLGFPQALIPDPRNTDHICKEFAKYKPTITSNVPSLYQMLLENPLFKTLEFSQLKACISGAAPFAVESLKALEKVVGEGKVLELYGMTETSPVITMNPLKGKKKIGTVGIPNQGTMMKLVDVETGTNEIPIGKEGEIIVRGSQVMKGYHNKPEETAHVFREFEGETWLHTGDVAKMDEAGFFTIVDRAKDMLNVSGFKVFSREVEESLYEHPAVEMCAIIGLPDADRPGSERVKAVVQLTKDHKDKNQDEIKQDITKYCKENMAPYKIPKIIEFVDELPLTTVGKVDKKVLR